MITDFEISHLRLDKYCFTLTNFGNLNRCNICWGKNDTAYWYCKTMKYTPDNNYIITDNKNWNTWIETEKI